MHRTLCLLLLLPLATAADDHAPEPEPGLYRVTAGATGPGLPPGAAEETVEQCLTEEDLAADPSTVLGENPEVEGCTVTSFDWSDGKISMQMQCAIEGIEATAESNGTYNSSGYEMITITRMNFGDTIMEMETYVRGERIGDC